MILEALARLNPSPVQRRYLYRLGVALGLVLAAYGVINDQTVNLWGVLLAALLGLADGNVDTSIPAAAASPTGMVPTADQAGSA